MNSDFSLEALGGNGLDDISRDNIFAEGRNVRMVSRVTGVGNGGVGFSVTIDKFGATLMRVTLDPRPHQKKNRSSRATLGPPNLKP